MRGQLEGKEPAGDEVKMELLCRTYGWTPTQVREQRLEDVEQLLVIIGERDTIEKARQIKARRK